jgi:hypothetical protein
MLLQANNKNKKSEKRDLFKRFPSCAYSSGIHPVHSLLVHSPVHGMVLILFIFVVVYA